MSTQSTAEAMAVLKKHRAFLIEQGRIIAFEIAQRAGTVHTRSVRVEMERRGLVSPTSAHEYWLGAVFNRNPVFRWTGDYFAYSDEDRNVHERTIKIWEINL